MTLTSGARIGPYEVTSPLGEGGMGIVFRARDTRLGRDVAIKVLPDAFRSDPDRLSRFQREARVLASLNHPNIAHIYGLEEFQDTRCIVMELVEGETLQNRLNRGPIPLDESLAIAKQIAEALEAAHEKGISHRDLKPANVKLTPDGKVKVLDFGLAKVNEAERMGEDLSDSPTLMSASTPGMIMGTAAYMSPEQAEGKEADSMSDAWAFGCVLYEMLTGRSVFEGRTIGEIFAGILKGEPEWSHLPRETPEGIRRLLHRCLTKDRKLRLQHLGDARIEIEDPRIINVVETVPRRRERFAWISALALVTAVAAVLGMRAFRSLPSPQEMRLEITTPPTSNPASLAISSDGQKIAFVATLDGRSQLWLRSLDSVSARPLAGTDGATYPFWSPDGRAVGFFSDSNLNLIDTGSHSVQILTKAPGGRGGAWNGDGTILFAQTTGPIFRISARGGEPVATTRLDTQQSNHRFPQFLPDGRHFLYYVLGSPETRGIYIGQLDGAEPRRLLDADTAAVYASSGQLLFARQGTLFAQHFDPVRMALIGAPFLVGEQVAIDAVSSNLGALSTSAAGPIVYRTGSAGGQRQLVLFDRSGKAIRKVGDPASAYGPSLSPDGRRVAMYRSVNGNFDIWLLELGRGILSRFTSDPAVDSFPVWSPDGSRIVFQSNRKNTFDLYRKPVTSAGSEELLLATPQGKTANDWSEDGRFLLYRSTDPKTGNDLWVLPMDGDQKPFPVVQTDFDELDGQFSPDGKWIAYQSNESGRFEIYVQPFPGPGARTQISTNGGAQVRWHHNGQELFYIALDDRLMAVPIQITSDGETIEADTPVPLFTTRVGGAVQGVFRPHYVVFPDGERFLMSTVIEEATAPITVILNWKPKQ